MFYCGSLRGLTVFDSVDVWEAGGATFTCSVILHVS